MASSFLGAYRPQRVHTPVGSFDLGWANSLPGMLRLIHCHSIADVLHFDAQGLLQEAGAYRPNATNISVSEFRDHVIGRTCDIIS